MSRLNQLLNYGKKLFQEKPKVDRKANAFGVANSGAIDLSNIKVGADTFFTVYKNNGDVYSVVREYQQNTLAKGFDWVNADDPEKEPDQAFVDRANGVYNFDMPFNQLKRRMIRDHLVTGNLYNNLLLSSNENLPFGDRVMGLQPIDPRTMAIIADTHGQVIKYKQRPRMAHDFVEFEKEEIAHWKNGTDPNHEIFGMSPLEPILWEARTDIQAMITNYSFFANNAMPAVGFILQEGLGEEEQKKAMDDINNQFKGSENAHKSLVLGGVKDIKQFNITQKDMEFLGGRRFTTEKVCSAFGVPKVVLNYTDGVNHATSQTQYQKFIENSVGPMDEDFAEFCNREINTRITLNGVCIADKIKMVPRSQSAEGQGEIEGRAIIELDAGVLTRRQYKKKTGQDIFPEDEAEPMFDKHIIRGGVSSVLLEDVGVDPFLDPNDSEQSKQFIGLLKDFKDIKNEKT